MKKTLIIILIIALLLTLGIILVNSIHAGKINILGLRELNSENNKLDSSIQKLSNLNSTVYQKARKDVSESAKEFEAEKSNYDELFQVSTGSEIATANQLQKYEIEYLWAKIGKHATDEDVLLKIEIAENSTSDKTGYYDLNFTAIGDYVGITDFIYDIENDSSLGFKIEKFKMGYAGSDDSNKTNQSNQTSQTNQTKKTETTQEENNKLQATFTCSNVAINIDPSLITKAETEEETKEENGNEANTDTNTTNTSNATNTTSNSNSTNTSNTNTSSTNSTR